MSEASTSAQDAVTNEQQMASTQSEDAAMPEEQQPAEQQPAASNSGTTSAEENDHSSGPRKIAYEELTQTTREKIEYNQDFFNNLPSRKDQIELILDKYGIKEIPDRMWFESALMCTLEPAPVDFRRQADENDEDYHKRAKAHFGNITEFTITQMYNGEDHCLSVLSAPSNLRNSWGFKDMSKQREIVAPQHLFRRVEPPDRNRLKRSINHLKSGDMKSILWLGASGIGKSLSVVDMLVQLVRDLEPGRYVGFHRRDTLTIYSKENGGLKKRQKKVNYQELKELALEELKDDLIMLIDPPEIVEDYEQFCPTLIALSTRLNKDDLKTFIKGSIRYVAIDPHTKSEVAAMATCIGAVDDAVTYDEVMKRYDKIGANLRVILNGKDDRYDTHLDDIANTKSSELIEEATDVNPLCVPKHYKYFVAPYNDPDFVFSGEDDGGCKVFQSAKTAVFFPWSDYTAQKLRELAEKDTEQKLMQSLERIGLPYVVEENAIQSFLLSGHPLTDWEWYKNVESGRTVNTVVADPPALAVQRVVRFEGRYFRTRLSALQEGILYKSSGWQMVLGDFFCIQRKAVGNGRIVYMIQVSSRDPTEHPFKMDQFYTWRQCLQMSAQDDIVIIYTTNKTHKELHGLRFKDAADADVASPCDGYIVRTPMTPGAPHNVMVITDTGESWNTEDPVQNGLKAGWKLLSQQRGTKRKFEATSPEGKVFSSLQAAKQACKAKKN